jgi:hypothetical protein
LRVFNLIKLIIFTQNDEKKNAWKEEEICTG